MKRKSAILVVLIFAFAAHALGQSGAGLGSISGVVQDASKAAVPGASVVISNEAKGIRRNLDTNGQGVFTAPALIPAEGYSVTVNKSGFATYQATGITLAAGQKIELYVELAQAGKGVGGRGPGLTGEPGKTKTPLYHLGVFKESIAQSYHARPASA